VEDTDHFALLYSSAGRTQLLQTNAVQSFKITLKGWQSALTLKHYQVQFSSLGFL
jgi:hypothetical protein